MSRFVKILSLLGVLLVAVVVAGIAVLKSKDFNEYKTLIAEEAKKATGRDLIIAGDLTLEISLSPALTAEGVTFSNASWGTASDMMTLKRLEAQVSLLPLLTGTVAVDRLVLSGLDVLVETDKAGKGNWEFAKATGEDKGKPVESKGGDATLPTVDLVQIRDVTVTYRDGKAGSVVKASLEHLEIEDDGGDGLALDVVGAVDHLTYAIKARLDLGADTVTLDKIKATVAGSDLAGRLAVRLSSPLAVTADLSSTLIDLDGFKAPGKESDDKAADKAAEKTAEKIDDTSTKVFPDDPLPVDGLKAVNADIQFKAATVKAAKLTVTDVQAKVALQGGTLTVKPLAATLADGRLTASLVLNASGKVPRLSLNLDGKQIDYGGLLKQYGLTDVVSGKVDASVNASGRGMSVRTIMAGLNGRAKVVSKDGRLDLGALSVLSAGVSVSDLAGALQKEKSTDADAQTLRCVYMDFPIKRGIAQAKAAVVETGGFAMIGDGGANLRDETLALRFQPRAKKASAATLVQPVTVAGTFAAPTFGVDAEKALTGAAVGAAAAAVATGGLSVVAGALIGAGAAQGVDETNYCELAFAGKPLKPTEKPAAASSSDSGSGSGTVLESVGGALKGLFGK